MTGLDRSTAPAIRARDNLTTLYGGFGKEVIEGLLPGDTFEVDGVTFVSKYSPESTADRFYIVKSLPLVERYRALSEQFAGKAIVELGIAEGGSTALLALLARPSRLVAVDLEPEPLGALADFIEARGLHDVVRPHYGVDQADRAGLAAVVDADLAGRPIDLVIDDCSHDLDLTRTSFETLFPRMRPGGLYVIEDWNNDQIMMDALVPGMRDPSVPWREELVQQMATARAARAAGDEPPVRRPLLQLGVELLLARSSLGDVVAEVVIDEHWITVRRGVLPLDRDGFRLEHHVSDHFGFLPPTKEPRVARWVGEAFNGSCPVCGTPGRFQRVRVTTKESFHCASCRASLRYQGQARAIVERYARGGATSLAALVAEPEFAKLHIYEPGELGPFRRWFKPLRNYQTTIFSPDLAPGAKAPDGRRNEDLMQLTFRDASFDLLLTSDVFEHVRHPELGWAETYRVLKPGGSHIFTVPLPATIRPDTVARVDVSGPEDRLLLDEHRHNGHLVYNDFGLDILDQLRAVGFEAELARFEGEGCPTSRTWTVVATRPA